MSKNQKTNKQKKRQKNKRKKCIQLNTKCHSNKQVLKYNIKSNHIKTGKEEKQRSYKWQPEFCIQSNGDLREK